jgi:hypothetical protein
MAFEILDPPPPFSSLPPLKRLLVLLLGAASLLGLIWCCDVAYHAKPVAPSTRAARAS